MEKKDKGEAEIQISYDGHHFISVFAETSWARQMVMSWSTFPDLIEIIDSPWTVPVVGRPYVAPT